MTNQAKLVKKKIQKKKSSDMRGKKHKKATNKVRNILN